LGKKNGKTTYIASVRRSYLQFLFKLIDLPFVPNYWDYQYKVTHKPDKRNEINVIGIGTIDQFSLNKPEKATLEQLAILDQVPLQGQMSYTFGVSWRHAMDKGYWQLVASRNYLRNEADQFEQNDEGNENRRILRYRSKEAENRMRYEVNFPLGKIQMNAGGHLILTGYENTTFQRRPAFTANYSTAFDMLRYGAFLTATGKGLDEKLTLSGGFRIDGNNYTSSGSRLGQTISPRLSLSYSLGRGVNLNASLARYYKLPSYTILGFQVNGVSVNKDAAYIRSDHLVAGIEWQPTGSTRVTAEGFLKKYGNYPVSAALGVSMANFGGDFGVFGNERITSNGSGEAFGYELLFQQRLTRNFYGILAYTYYHSRFSGIDPKQKLPSAWDNRHLLSFTGGYRFKKNWEVGLRFRYLGGAPYTPYDISRSLDNYPFTYEPVFNNAQLNSLRLQGFHAADLRIDKKFNFRKWTFDLYLDIQNAYNSQNPSIPGFTLQRNPDESIATRTGEPYNAGSYINPAAPNNRQKAIPVLLEGTTGALLPSIGFVVEF